MEWELSGGVTGKELTTGETLGEGVSSEDLTVDFTTADAIEKACDGVKSGLTIGGGDGVNVSICESSLGDDAIGRDLSDDGSDAGESRSEGCSGVKERDNEGAILEGTSGEESSTGDEETSGDGREGESEDFETISSEGEVSTELDTEATENSRERGGLDLGERDESGSGGNENLFKGEEGFEGSFNWFNRRIGWTTRHF